jgi:hypothetical protein
VGFQGPRQGFSSLSGKKRNVLYVAMIYEKRYLEIISYYSMLLEII